MKKGQNQPQEFSEIITDLEQAKQRGLSVTRGQSLYKAQTGAYSEGKLKALIHASMDDLTKYADSEKIYLGDAEKVKERMIIYLRCCEETGTFPSSLGLARSLGCTRRALNYWRERNPKTETARWLEMFAELCLDVLNQSALRNNSNAIVSIFLAKSMYGLQDKSEIVLSSQQYEPEAASYSESELMARYGLDTAQTND
jgi:hypothetical protein